MIHFEMSSKPYQFIVVVLVIAFLIIFLSTIAYGYDRRTRYPYDPDEITEHIFYPSLEDRSLSRIRSYLRENDWVKDYVTEEELDYILLLARHLSVYYDNIDPNLIIAMIAVESRFDNDAKNYGARGLMQLIESYHQDRLIQFIEDDERYSRDLFYEPRLNIMTGMDYMSYILHEVNGDTNYALMWYNQGAISACTMYEENGLVSTYAKSIQKLAKELSRLCEN